MEKVTTTMMFEEPFDDLEESGLCGECMMQVYITADTIEEHSGDCICPNECACNDFLGGLTWEQISIHSN